MDNKKLSIHTVSSMLEMTILCTITHTLNAFVNKHNNCESNWNPNRACLLRCQSWENQSFRDCGHYCFTMLKVSSTTSTCSKSAEEGNTECSKINSSCSNYILHIYTSWRKFCRSWSTITLLIWVNDHWSINTFQELHFTNVVGWLIFIWGPQVEIIHPNQQPYFLSRLKAFIKILCNWVGIGLVSMRQMVTQQQH